jgi:hypothetical protein
VIPLQGGVILRARTEQLAPTEKSPGNGVVRAKAFEKHQVGALPPLCGQPPWLPSLLARHQCELLAIPVVLL